MRSPVLIIGSIVLLLTFGSWGLTAPAPPLPAAGKPTLQSTLEGHKDIINGLSFSPDGKYLVSAGRGEGVARLWDVGTGKCLHVLKGHKNLPGKNSAFVFGAAFAPDGKTVATGGDDGTVRLWDVKTGGNTTTLKAGGLVDSVLFSPDGKTLAWYSEKAHLWDLVANKEKLAYRVATSARPKWIFTPKGNLLAAVIGKGPRFNPPFSIWDISESKELHTFNLPEQTGPFAFSPDGKVLAALCMARNRKQTFCFWDAATGKQLKVLNLNFRTFS